MPPPVPVSLLMSPAVTTAARGAAARVPTHIPPARVPAHVPPARVPSTLAPSLPVPTAAAPTPSGPRGLGFVTPSRAGDDTLRGAVMLDGGSAVRERASKRRRGSGASALLGGLRASDSTAALLLFPAPLLRLPRCADVSPTSMHAMARAVRHVMDRCARAVADVQ
jgi:hypothetical protein